MAADKGALRDAAWIDARVKGYSIILLCGTLATLLWLLAGHGVRDPAGRPVGTDFLQFWSGSWAVWHGKVAALYRPSDLWALEQQLFPTVDMRDSLYAWLYPPTLLLIVAPLALLPYVWAWLCWLALWLGAYAAAARRILPHQAALLAALAFPAVLQTITQGQTSVFLVPLLAWGLILLPKRPVAAGILLGALAVKPQFAMLVPVALLAGGHGRAFLAAAAAFLLMAALSVALFGLPAWAGFAQASSLAGNILNHDDLSPYYRLQSVFAALRLLGAPLALAYGVQIPVAVAALAGVVWAWRQPAGQGLKNAALCAAIPLATPYILDYDLLVLAPAMLWLAAEASRTGARPWERITMLMVFAVPLYARALGKFTHVDPAPVMIAVLLGLILTRLRDQRAPDPAISVPAISAAVAS